MKAWHFTKTGSPLELTEIPDPVPGTGEVLIDVKAAGLCHTDISFIDGQVPGMPTHTPIVLGHEIAGVIAVYELLDSGQLNPLITTIGFDEIGTGLDRLRHGEAQGRLVATLY
jgi:D-arabinose 1-dehydrogenase-like Zn-dependent alcohol dehydrogenase